MYKPDFKYYGFNHPDGTKADGSDHGYERWLTIPDDREVEAPFVKKQFPGGLYAAHTIPMGAFEEWHWLWSWVEKHEQFEMDLGDAACMSGLLEDHLNFKNLWSLDISPDEMDKLMQLDLLIPIRVTGQTASNECCNSPKMPSFPFIPNLKGMAQNSFSFHNIIYLRTIFQKKLDKLNILCYSVLAILRQQVSLKAELPCRGEMIKCLF